MALTAFTDGSNTVSGTTIEILNVGLVYTLVDN